MSENDTPWWASPSTWFSGASSVPVIAKLAQLGGRAGAGIGNIGLNSLARFGARLGNPTGAATAIPMGIAGTVSALNKLNGGLAKQGYMMDLDGNLQPIGVTPDTAQRPAMSPMPAVSPWPLQANGMNPGTPPMPFGPSAPTSPAPMGPAPSMTNVPIPQPRPPMQTVMSARAQPGAPMNILPQPNGQVAPVTNKGDWAQNSPMMARFLGALMAGAKGINQVPQQQQQPQGLIPRMIGDFQGIGKLFGGGGSIGPSSADPTQLGSLY